MARYWQADDAFFELVRDREVLTCIVAEVAGPTVANANAGEKAKTLKRIVRDHLDGTDGRRKVDGWVPRWMAFPPTAYTVRAGVGTVETAATVAAAPLPDAPDPAQPGKLRAPPAPSPEPQPQPPPRDARSFRRSRGSTHPPPFVVGPTESSTT